MQLRNAFTLVELIMVVSLIGVMAVFAVPSYTKAVKKSYEKAGVGNLLTIYSAQRIRFNTLSSYVAAADTNAINDPANGLGLSIIGNGMNYSCTAPGGTSFDCRAARTDGSFTLKVIDSNNNVCCQAGSCPSVSGC
ncbi:MAG: prepilin-type N-terminal cleavage/methylation domain-containing protein [Candidatus Omnitrophica bacterium]|nr:prepilin-type N-terminal cleavage/methylation domain-containing protein [Candidatus Omnitrophota bacterium]